MLGHGHGLGHPTQLTTIRDTYAVRRLNVIQAKT